MFQCLKTYGPFPLKRKKQTTKTRRLFTMRSGISNEALYVVICFVVFGSWNFKLFCFKDIIIIISSTALSKAKHLVTGEQNME